MCSGDKFQGREQRLAPLRRQRAEQAILREAFGR